ncbi:MAG: MarR family winged helix-turn-helix transcriptional regulator [Actinomycetota bacterium]
MSEPTEQQRGIRPRYDSAEQETFLNLWRTYDLLKLLEDELFGRHELTAQQYNALRLLRTAHPEQLPTLVLASQLVSRAPDITRLIDRLHERGLVVRERKPEDRRTVYVGITEAGRALLDNLARSIQECHTRQLGHLTADELKILTRLLRKARMPHEADDSNWR